MKTAVPSAAAITTVADLLNRLQRQGGHLAAAGGRWLYTAPGAPAVAPRPVVALAAVDAMRSAGQLVPCAGGGLRLVETAGPPASARRPPPPVEGGQQPVFNDAESPLGWLRARKDRTGRPLITLDQFRAGERLRADYERAAMGARVTANWDGTGGRGKGAPAPMTITEAMIAARQRYHAALAAIGEELADILVQVCCLSAGIEQAERILDLPQRSGRVVLGLGLTALARHYGFIGSAKRAARPAHWGQPGYRPEIAPPTED